MTTLLGHLAQFGSFSMQSEVLCTQGLTYLLQTYEDARSALADEVQARTGVGIGASLTWLAEAVAQDGGRPDLEARTADEVPVAKIEAKLGAELLPEQLQSYAADLSKRNSGKGALLVLVPKGRTSEAAGITAAAFDLSGPGPWPATDGHRLGVAVISWDALFAALEAGQAERFRHELEQLQAMYRVLSGSYIAPLASIEELREWRDRETDLVNVVEQVTRRLTTQDRPLPMGSEPLENAWDDHAHEHEPGTYRRRYVCTLEGGVESCFSIGVRDSFAQWVTPVWMRFHKGTGHFALIRQRIKASSLRSLDSGGHLWIPLDVPLQVPGEQMIQSLIQQAEKVLGVAYPAK